ncbi:NrtR DNA-binding winged helix domain-containing protein [Dyadobacter sp. 3J3]|uniref:NUDIX hydrolase n=1 Tax=Dyadobacter sp. 3J3 TaxID=2606600 RepID=UPI00190F1F8A|nr:NUDIX domain-containing protein [Dyadobacter sp. 3J3]
MLHQYQTQTKCLVALDSIIFGFDGHELKLLLVKRGIEDEHHTWSLMGGWVQPEESLEQASNRILFELTSLTDIYLEQLHTFGNPMRDPVERTVSVAYFALINVEDYDNKISKNFEAQWFSMQELPQLLFDHSAMVEMAIEHLRYKASQHPIGFELLPEKFTIPQLQKLYEAIFGTELDKRNFSRKLLSTHLLVKLEEKQKGFSKKGAYFYKINEEKYKKQFNTFLNFLPNGNT